MELFLHFYFQGSHGCITAGTTPPLTVAPLPGPTDGSICRSRSRSGRRSSRSAGESSSALADVGSCHSVRRSPDTANVPAAESGSAQPRSPLAESMASAVPTGLPTKCCRRRSSRSRCSSTSTATQDNSTSTNPNHDQSGQLRWVTLSGPPSQTLHPIQPLPNPTSSPSPTPRHASLRSPTTPITLAEKSLELNAGHLALRPPPSKRGLSESQ